MLRRVWLAWLAAIIAGCKRAAPTSAPAPPANVFKDEDEELGYLRALWSPTLEQWRRREVLRAKESKRERVEQKKRDDKDYVEIYAEMARMEQDEEKRRKGLLKSLPFDESRDKFRRGLELKRRLADIEQRRKAEGK